MIDDITQKRLRAKYNPEGSPLRVHQLKMLEMLKYFDSICKKNDIKYWLSSGTCLGAIRHGGFIPWDDDMDIEMLRSDYLKLVEVFKETDDYILQTWKNDKYYCLSFAKMRDKNSKIYNSLFKYKGVFIDILVLEKSPKFLSLLTCYSRNILWKVYTFVKQGKKFSWLFTLLKFMFFNIMIPICRFLSKISNCFFNNKYRHTLGTGWVNNTRFLNEILPTKNIDFEGVQLPIPNNYDKYLKRIYGNYMEIPQIENIQLSHVEFFKSPNNF